jgi:adenosylhomocysteinase
MTKRIEWVASSCRLLAGIAQEFEATRPFEAMTIGTGIHLEPKTAVLLTTLQRGGAQVVATGNLNSTQGDTVDYLRGCGVEVIAGLSPSEGAHDDDLWSVLNYAPQLILDNGGDLFARYVKDPYEGLLGGTEETTSGRARLRSLLDQLTVPILVINDSPIKQFAENQHAVGQSVFESFMRITNRSTQGKRVVVFGYGPCGRGIAANFRNASSIVTVLETDPVLRLNALLDGFDVQERATALAEADVIITATGANHVVTVEDLASFHDDAILMNAGHFPHEIDVVSLMTDLSVRVVSSSTPGLQTMRMHDGRSIHLLGEGHMVNLAGPSPLGNSIESMDLGFALQARCLEAVATRTVDPKGIVVPVPRHIDEMVAEAYLALVAGSVARETSPAAGGGE